ncbi:MAG: ABC transporter substrate-binding protein [Planctomycetota bacterium]|nr:ABC transporter substrate-binding protein [Planctomycetota bacterium]
MSLHFFHLDHRRVVNPLLALLVVALATAGCQQNGQQPVKANGTTASTSIEDTTEGTFTRSTIKRTNRLPEPEPDTSIPIGTADPPFLGELPSEAIVVNRTGTYGGRFVYAILGEVETFNPIEPKGATDQEIRSLVFSGLVGYSNGKWKHEPLLAKSWDVSDDNLTWTFHMREGVEWSDGQPVTIDDVLFTFQAVFHDQIATSIKDGFKHPITGELPQVSLDRENNAIVFQLARIDSQFLTHIGAVRIIPHHKWKDHLQAENPTLLQQMTSDAPPEDLVGCGPFMLKKYVPSEKIVYQRNPRYWKKDARDQRLPYLDELVILLVKDLNLQWQKFEAGELDIFMDLPADHYKEAAAMEKSGKADLVRLGVSLNSNWICFNLHPGKDPESGEPFVEPQKAYWFQNLNFRKAVNHAIDRDGIQRTAFQGRATPIWSSFTPGNRSWYHEGVPTYPHSTDKANQYLDDLGWIDSDGDGVREDDQGRPIRFNLNTNVENNLRQQIGNLIAQDLTKVGIQVNFKPIIFNDLVTSLRDSHKWDIILLGWGSGVPPDPANGKNITTSSGRLHAWYPQQPEPATDWERRVDELMTMMDEELDNKVRKKYNDEIQELIGENIPILYLIAANSYCTVQKDRVGNLWPSLLRPQLTWNLESLWIRP